MAPRRNRTRARSPRAGSIEAQGLGWHSSYGDGHGKDTVSSGLEVTWTKTPTLWSNNFFENLFKFEWEPTESPAGAKQWVAKDAPEIIPDAHVPGKFHKPTMLTTDLTLRFDPEFGKISKRFLDDPQAFAEAFARAWYKLIHRDMGPKARYLGPEVPKEDLIWQDPLPAATHNPTAADIADIKARIAASGLSVGELCRWPGPRPPPSAAATSAAAPTARAWPWHRRGTGRSTRPPSRRCPSWSRSRRPPARPRWPT
jgi:catalase-peroxidase